MKDSDKQVREKIQALNEAPGSNFDKEAAWQKLQLRMENKPAISNHKKWYYSIAAVIIALCIGIPVLMNSRKSEVESRKLESEHIVTKPKAESQKPKPENTMPAAPTIANTQTATTTHPKYNIKNTTTIASAKESKAQNSKSSFQNPVSKIQFPVSGTQHLLPAVALAKEGNIQYPVSSTEHLLPAVASAKEGALAKVVHINEIDDPQPAPPPQQNDFFAQRYKTNTHSTTATQGYTSNGYKHIRF